MAELRRAVPIAVAFLAGIAAPTGALNLTDAERQAICAEAEGRYREIADTLPKAEGATVILMFKDTFCPRELTVKRGARLRWINVDKRTSHSVWFKEAGKPESDRAFPEEVVDMTIDWPAGEYPYLCGPHWEKEGMTGVLKVTGE
jgi:plastocyanin